MNGLKYILLITCICLTSIAYTQSESQLRIITPDRTVTFDREALLTHPALTPVTINNDRAYPNQIMSHKGIPLCKLLRPYVAPGNKMIEFVAKDDFHVYVPAQKIMDCSKHSSIGMLTIEPQSKWPVIDNHTGTTAGPYEIIWLYPERSYISNEYWAWSVVAIKIMNDHDYKDLLPAPKTADQSIINGHKIYISHCEGCHAMNRIGKSKIGPDLNCSKNPWEYYPDRVVLKKFIREPKSVRVLSKGRMSGSDPISLSENDLDDLIKFFAVMKNKKEC
ncbi:cytochrome c [Legionella lytica]|uniref:Cytochrome c n=1 Tax=Legionella lytica TaxID=96232 RepID=A0ABY4Y5R3_9GAMM|nr:c-type cytochrome [Legionella lytica]USQ12683.1 cytochrome c [Legionella lytica]